MMSLPKTMETKGKWGRRQKQIKYKSLERVWWELFKNVTFIEFEPLCQKLWTFMSNLQKPLTKYDHVTWPWLQIPKIFIFCLILYQILEKVTKFGGNWFKNKKLQAKTNWGWKHPHSTSDSRIYAIFWQNSRGHARWGRERTSCCSLLDVMAQYAMTESHFLMQLGVQGAKPVAPEIWHLKVQNATEKLNFVVQFPSTKWI